MFSFFLHHDDDDHDDLKRRHNQTYNSTFQITRLDSRQGFANSKLIFKKRNLLKKLA